MVTIISRPTQSQFGQIPCTDDKASALIGQVHKYLSPLSRLSILIGHVMFFRILTDISEMKRYCFPNIYFQKLCPKFMHKLAGIIIGSVCRSETWHSDCFNLFSVQTEHVKGPRYHEQCKR